MGVKKPGQWGRGRKIGLTYLRQELKKKWENEIWTDKSRLVLNRINGKDIG